MEAFRDIDGKFLMVYLPVTKEIEIDMSGIRGKKITAWWFNPKTGKVLKIGQFGRTSTMKFKPSVESNHKDWVLMIDDSKYSFDVPGL